jgi:hypothetical protein
MRRPDWLELYQSYQAKPVFDNVEQIISFYRPATAPRMTVEGPPPSRFTFLRSTPITWHREKTSAASTAAAHCAAVGLREKRETHERT